MEMIVKMRSKSRGMNLHFMHLLGSLNHVFNDLELEFNFAFDMFSSSNRTDKNMNLYKILN